MRAALVLVLLAVSLAHAESTPGSTIAQVMLLEASDSSYELFHGAIWLDKDKATTNYRWGGAQCKGRDLTDTSVQVLYAAYRAGDFVAVEYVTNDYKAKTYRCITGFTLSKS
jgi:hypothetical protein